MVDGKYELVKHAIDKGIDPSVNRNYAIREASRNGYSDIVALLLATNLVDPGARNNEPLILAINHGHTEVVKLLLPFTSLDPQRRAYRAVLNARLKGHQDILALLKNNPRHDGMRWL